MITIAMTIVHQMHSAMGVTHLFDNGASNASSCHVRVKVYIEISLLHGWQAVRERHGQILPW
eukprot:1146849-Pelagomonas_calceolata.AAC.9